MQFDARIDGKLIHCRITSDRDLKAPVFCFSCMAPVTVVEGGTRIAATGGYAEVALPDLQAGQPHDVTLRHENPEFAPANRAWLPLGAYLRTQDGPLDLPALPDGVRPERRDTVAADWPRVCPRPTRAEAAADHLIATSFAAPASEPLSAADDLAARVGLGPFLSKDGARLSVELDETLPPEAYRLTVTPEGATLRHGDRAGALHGAVTLLTLARTHDGRIPCGEIEDAPRFGWRGQHLDCARHFYSVDTILRLLDLMALLKLNRFHWHFADDEAFRLALDSLPELAKTHFRGEDELIPGVFGGGIRSGGSYSRADVARVLARAAELGIEVMPEIEVPAHALALARVYPGTRDPEDTGTERSVQGYAANVMNPAMTESWRVWHAMVDEIAGLFPFDVIHLGCDELPDGTWQGSPAARRLMDDEGLDTTDDLQGWTINRLARRVAEHGKTPAAWEEAARGQTGIENGAILFSWTGQGPGLDAARAGYKVVMTPAQHVYLDMAHTADPEDWGANWAAFVALEDTVAWDPVPGDEPALADNIIGVQGTFWSEFTMRDDQIEAMLMPRLLGVATMAWQDRGSADPALLPRLAASYQPILAAMGWQSA